MGGQFGVNEGRLTADLGWLQWCGRPEISPERRWTSYRLSSLVWAGFADVVSKVTARYEIASVNRPGAKNHDPARNGAL